MSYHKVECSVHLEPSKNISNIRLFEDGFMDLKGTNHEGGESMMIVFRDPNGYAIATSDKDDKYPQIGLDFIWPYVQSKGFEKNWNDRNPGKPIKSVYVSFKSEYPLNSQNVALHKNGDVIVSRCDEKEFTEKDVVMMLSYAVAHEKVTAKEMKEKVSEILNWFKSNV